MFRATSLLRQAVRTRTSTGLTGLAVHPAPLPVLLSTYSSTLHEVSRMPPSAVYRQSVESITKERIAIIERLGGEGQESDIVNVEAALGAGLIEEVLVQAREELLLAGKILEWKAWEELEEVPEKGQWAPFKVTPSTTTAEDLH